MALYAQTSGGQSTSSASWEKIPGLGFTIPEGVGTSALVILNLPNPYATGNNYPGGVLGISVNGTVSPVVASFTYNEQVPPSTGRIPTTLSAYRWQASRKPSRRCGKGCAAAP
ncbi:MAG: hypothetical protein NVS2B1_16250 [Bradyrhizobium sp.]